MNDLTILYYTANTIPDVTGRRIRDNLLKVTGNQFPIISVSQKPINFGRNICVGEIGRSKYNCYKQILIGVKEVKTKYAACAEDDVLYSKDHFKNRPEDDVFLYDRNYWFAGNYFPFYWRLADVNKRGGMWGCISTAKTLLNNLTTRYDMYPTDPMAEKYDKSLQWGEPGIRDEQFGMKNNHKFIESDTPSIIFIHDESMGYKQLRYYHQYYGNPSPANTAYNLQSVGGIKKLWQTYWS